MSTILLNDYALHLYYIILLKSLEVGKLQVAILARSSREMYQTVRIVCKHILSQVSVSVRPSNFLYAKYTQNLGKPDRPRVCIFEWSSDAHCRQQNGPSRLGTTDPSHIANLKGSAMCVCACVCVRACACVYVCACTRACLHA